MILLRRENERRDKGERDEVIDSDHSGEEMDEMALRNGRFETVNDARREKGDEWSQFRYTL
jgi:hypothetical protein